jgi:hypothetical protein
LFLPGLLLRPLALLPGRLCALLLLRSALLPLGTGLSLRLAPIFASILLLFPLVSLRKAGNCRAGHKDQGGRVDYSYYSHGRWLSVPATAKLKAQTACQWPLTAKPAGP